MSLVMQEALAELLPWDSEFFGFSIGRVRGDTLDENQLAEIDRWSRSEAVTALYFLARPDDPGTIHTVENGGFRLVDIRVTFEYKFEPKSVPRPNSDEPRTRAAKQEDLPALQAIARTAHSDTRFFNDPGFPASRAQALYAKWIELECKGRAQHVIVPVSDQDKALGYLSCHLDEASGVGQIGLVGIEQASRGKGLAKAAVAEALRWFNSRAAQRVGVVTQGKNVAAQRLYQRCGFLISDLQLWYHKWYSAAAGANG
jgi:dTDP-4-amino-4,6-dideoxy-D-galactose acyltransferase